MENLSSLETTVLVDMLANYTATYLTLSYDIGKEEEYARIVLTLKAIQAEIDFRKRTPQNTSTTDPAIIIQ
jgi:hypothetical protein